MKVKLLIPTDIPALIALRREALESSPLSFASSLEDDRCLKTDFMQNSFTNTESFATFGLFLAEQLVGMVGLGREAKLKARHKAYIWGMYVRGENRGQGGASQLMNAAIAHARSWSGILQIHLSVSETAQEAKGLYTKMGFQEWGREPRALQWEGQFVDEVHLVLNL